MTSADEGRIESNTGLGKSYFTKKKLKNLVKLLTTNIPYPPPPPPAITIISQLTIHNIHNIIYHFQMLSAIMYPPPPPPSPSSNPPPPPPLPSSSSNPPSTARLVLFGRQTQAGLSLRLALLSFLSFSFPFSFSSFWTSRLLLSFWGDFSIFRLLNYLYLTVLCLFSPSPSCFWTPLSFWLLLSSSSLILNRQSFSVFG